MRAIVFFEKNFAMADEGHCFFSKKHGHGRWWMRVARVGLAALVKQPTSRASATSSILLPSALAPYVHDFVCWSRIGEELGVGEAEERS